NLFSIDKLGEDNHSRNSDFIIWNFATQGVTFWKHTYGGSGWDDIAEIIETSDGGFFCVGASDSNDGDITESNGGLDVWILKLNQRGELEWTRNLGGTGNDRAYTAIETRDGDFLIGGESGSVNGDMYSIHHGSLDSWIARLDKDGNFIWEKHFGGAGNEKVNRIHELSSGELMVFNASDSPGGSGDVKTNLGKKDCWIFRMDTKGNIKWQTSIGGAENDDIHSTIIDHEGNFVVAGTTFSGDGYVPRHRGLGDFWVFKMSQEGILHWSKTFGGRREEGANHVIQTSDSNYVVCGITKSRPGEEDSEIEYNYGYYDGWILKLDQNGNRKWSRTLGYAGADGMEQVVELKKGGFLTMGFSQLPRKSGPVPGHNGSSDIWLANFSDPAKSSTRAYVTPPLMLGTVKDKDTGKFLEAQIV
ncbi:MAG: hypothetical protein KDD63_25010, partial [Bacteroidetes bacterium]|nr:hypothetical protein [Bacteroidota bacterium]